MEQDKYEYFSMVAMFYEMGKWDEETVIKKVESYAKDNEIDIKVIKDFLGRLIKKKEHTIEEKRSFLGAIKFNNGEPKYGDAVNVMSDEMVDKYYEIESQAIGIEATEKLHNNLSNVTEEKTNKEQNNTSVQSEESKKGDDTYSMKGGERFVVNPSSNNTSTASNDQNKQAETPKQEPTTEEDYQHVAENMHTVENDSNVRHVDASPERIEKLKKSKTRAKQFFLKAGVVVATFAVASGFAIPLVGGYLILASQIKNGTYKIPGKVGVTIKKVVEGIMDLGKTPEEKQEAREERGKSR